MPQSLSELLRDFRKRITDVILTCPDLTYRDIAQRFERDGERGDAGLQPVGTNEVAEAAHQLRIVDFADDIIVGFALGLARSVLGFVLGPV